MQMSNILKQIMDKRQSSKQHKSDSSDDSNMQMGQSTFSKKKKKDFNESLFMSPPPILHSIKKLDQQNQKNSFDDLFVNFSHNKERVEYVKKTSHLDKQFSKQLSSELKEQFEKFDKKMGVIKNQSQYSQVNQNSSMTLLASGKDLGLRLTEEDYSCPPQELITQEDIKTVTSGAVISSQKLNESKYSNPPSDLFHQEVKRMKKERSQTLKIMKYSTTSQPMDKLFAMIKSINVGAIDVNLRGEKLPSEKRIMQINSSHINDIFQKEMPLEEILIQIGNEELDEQDIGSCNEGSSEECIVDTVAAKKEASHKRFIRRQMHQQVFYSQGQVLLEKEPSVLKGKGDEDEEQMNKTMAATRSMFCRTAVADSQRHKKVCELFKGPQKEDNQQIQEENSSVVKYKVSEFYSKYVLYNNYASNKLQNKNKRLNNTIQIQILCFIVMCSMPIYFIAKQTQIVNYLQNQVDLLTINSEFMRTANEIHLCSNYWNFLKTTTQTVPSKAIKLWLVPMALMNSYANSASIFNSVFLNNQFQDIITEYSTTVWLSETYQDNLQAIQIIMCMMSNMLEIKQMNDPAKILASTSYQFYIKNLPQILDIVQLVSSKITDQIGSKIQSGNNSALSILITFSLILICIMALQFYFFTIFCEQQHHQRELFEYSDLSLVLVDLEKLHFIQNVLQSKKQSLFHYDFDLIMKEDILKKDTSKSNSFKQKKKKNSRMNLEIDGKDVPRSKYMVWQVVIMILFLIFGVFVYAYFNNFLNVYKNNVGTLEDYGNFQFVLPELSLLWVVIDHNSNSVQKAEQKQVFEKLLSTLNEVLRNELMDVQTNSNLPSDFITQVQEINNANLCQGTLKIFNSSSIAAEICKDFMKASLTKGLLNSVMSHQEYMRNLVYLDFDENTDYLQSGAIESILIIDENLTNLQLDLISSLENTSSTTVLGTYIASILFLIVLIVYNIIFSVFSKKQMQSIDHLNRHSIFLIPQQTLFIDARFIARMRAYLLKFGMSYLLD